MMQPESAASAIIRRAQLTDIPAINDVHRRAVLAQAAPCYSAAQYAAWARVPLTQAHVDQLVRAILDDYVWVAEHAEQVAAYAHARWLASKQLMYLESLYVSPPRTGLGHGRALLATAEATAVLREARGVQLHAALTAVSFYANHGYQPVGAEDSLPLGAMKLLRQSMYKPWAELLEHTHTASIEKA